MNKKRNKSDKRDSFLMRLARTGYDFLQSKVHGFRLWHRKLYHKICKRRRRWVVFSLITSMVLCITCYFVENQPYNVLDKSLVYYLLELPFIPKPVEGHDDVCFINVSHDRQLVNLVPGDSTMGNDVITDRRKLLKFLQIIDSLKIDYNYILMDIRFEKGDSTSVDSMLFNQIYNMRDIVIAHHSTKQNKKKESDASLYVWQDKYEIADSIKLLPKTGMSDYKQFGFANDFSRYSFLQEGKPSMALKMYDGKEGNQSTSIKKVKRLPIYYHGPHLCMNAPLMYISGNVYDQWTAYKLSGKTGKTISYYEDLGADYLYLMGRDLKADLDNKFIVIADFEQDAHDTYVGLVSGAYITWMAFQYLKNRRHILYWSFIILLFACYSFVFFMTFYINDLSQSQKYVDDESAQSVLAILRWVGSFGLLYLLTFITYKCFHLRFNFTIPFIFVTIVNFIIQTANRYEESNDTNDSNAATRE